ncbi:MAG: 4'-phosphopantetheinyl transferase superfamily protein [Ruminococcaceae bacterium]|nr:4'-phosphopantetheinyl transferase superfamily protein [Oscillospiraceae bacterium]
MSRVYLMRTDRQDLSAAAWGLLEQILGHLPAVERGPHGKPFFPDHPDLQFSLSHTKGAVACAVSDRPCGLDIELENRKVNLAVARRFFTPREMIDTGNDALRFLEVWTRKEALIKRSGGMPCPLKELETIGHPEILTKLHSGFVISHCNEIPEFTVTIVNQIYDIG